MVKVVKVVSEDSFMLKYYLDRYQTQEICHKAVVCLPILRFVPHFFLHSLFTNKMLEKLGYIEFSNYRIDLDDIDPDTVSFFSNDLIWTLLLQILIKLTLKMMILMKMIETIGLATLNDWLNRYKPRSVCGKK